MTTPQKLTPGAAGPIKQARINELFSLCGTKLLSAQEMDEMFALYREGYTRTAPTAEPDAGGAEAPKFVCPHDSDGDGNCHLCYKSGKCLHATPAPETAGDWAERAAKEIQPKAWQDGEVAALKLCDRKTANECREEFIKEYAAIIRKHAPHPTPPAREVMEAAEGAAAELRKGGLVMTPYSIKQQGDAHITAIIAKAFAGFVAGEVQDGAFALLDAAYKAACARADSAQADNARLREALNIIPPARLRVLADWQDLIDKERGITGDEVQRDLRRMANAAESALTSTASKAP